MPLKPHPTDLDKMVYVKRKYRNPEEAWDEPRTWVGLTDVEIKEIWLAGIDRGDDWLDVQGIARAIENALRSRNT